MIGYEITVLVILVCASALAGYGTAVFIMGSVATNPLERTAQMRLSIGFATVFSLILIAFVWTALENQGICSLP